MHVGVKRDTFIQKKWNNLPNDGLIVRVMGVLIALKRLILPKNIKEGKMMILLAFNTLCLYFKFYHSDVGSAVKLCVPPN